VIPAAADRKSCRDNPKAISVDYHELTSLGRVNEKVFQASLVLWNTENQNRLKGFKVEIILWAEQSAGTISATTQPPVNGLLQM
jgi:hypothetical protein